MASCVTFINHCFDLVKCLKVKACVLSPGVCCTSGEKCQWCHQSMLVINSFDSTQTLGHCFLITADLSGLIERLHRYARPNLKA